MLAFLQQPVVIVVLGVPAAVALGMALIGFPLHPFGNVVRTFLFWTAFIYAIIALVWAMVI